ncbi:hypothetical protein B0H19DRAFT_1141986 [Mycena capillaripes]|nr:hypothetical protein B0H19DRAFT_1141986 [Mycena capillaripes]
MKELVQIFQSLDGPTTPSDLRVTVPGLICLVIANSALARFVRFLELPALQESHIASTAADLISLLASSLPLGWLTLRIDNSPWPRQSIEHCFSLIPNLSYLTPRDSTISEPLFREDFIVVLADAQSNHLLPNLLDLTIYARDSLPEDPWFQRLADMLVVRRMRMPVKLEAFTLKFLGEFYFGGWGPGEPLMDIFDTLAADGLLIEPYKLFCHY